MTYRQKLSVVGLGSLLLVLPATLLVPSFWPSARSLIPQSAIVLSDAHLVWLVIAAVLVVFMQVGFLAFNTASVHPKHAQTVVAAIILNFIACGLGYTLIGYGLMFGASFKGVG